MLASQSVGRSRNPNPHSYTLSEMPVVDMF